VENSWYGSIGLGPSEPTPDTVLHPVQRQVSQRSILQRLWILQCCIVSPLTLPTHTGRLKFSHLNSGWDVHDAVYSQELLISNKANGYRDVIAEIDLSTYRRIPWEENVPFFLVSFLDPDTREPLSVCPRGVVSLVTKRSQALGWTPIAGCEYEVRILSFVWYGSH